MLIQHSIFGEGPWFFFCFVSHGKQPKIQINFVENKLSQVDNELAQKTKKNV